MPYGSDKHLCMFPASILFGLSEKTRDQDRHNLPALKPRTTVPANDAPCCPKHFTSLLHGNCFKSNMHMGQQNKCSVCHAALRETTSRWLGRMNEVNEYQCPNERLSKTSFYMSIFKKRNQKIFHQYHNITFHIIYFMLPYDGTQ